jgi:deoxyribodipyrimidine photo-lyase
MQKTEITNLVWFRNDLRTNDNMVLYEATKHNAKVIGVYCFDPKQFEVDTYGFKKPKNSEPSF